MFALPRRFAVVEASALSEPGFAPDCGTFARVGHALRPKRRMAIAGMSAHGKVCGPKETRLFIQPSSGVAWVRFGFPEILLVRQAAVPSASSVRQSRSNLLAGCCQPIIEMLEGRRMLSSSTVQSLPFLLDFSTDRGELLDKDGEGTGFTRVQANNLGTEYQPTLIDLDTAGGVLKMTTSGSSTSGTNSTADNTMVNGLETQFD